MQKKNIFLILFFVVLFINYSEEKVGNSVAAYLTMHKERKMKSLEEDKKTVAKGEREQNPKGPLSTRITDG